MLYFAYLDEFGHDGAFISCQDARYNDHPAYGLGGLVLPEASVRPVASWFYHLKQDLLREDPEASGRGFEWEKKGSKLYTTRNVDSYPELRFATRRLLDRLPRAGGFLFFAGTRKSASPLEHSAERLHLALVREVIKRLDDHCAAVDARFLLLLDQKATASLGASIRREAALVMYGSDAARNRLIEQPWIVNSLEVQLMQYADWLCGLLGRYVAFQMAPAEFPDFQWAETQFGTRIRRVSIRSGIRSGSD